MHQRQGDVTMAIVCNRWSAYNIFTNDRCARCFYSDFEIYRTNKWKRLCLGYCLKRYTARCRRGKQRRETHAALIQRYQIERACTSYNDAMYLISSYIPRGWNNYQKKIDIWIDLKRSLSAANTWGWMIKSREIVPFTLAKTYNLLQCDSHTMANNNNKQYEQPIEKTISTTHRHSLIVALCRKLLVSLFCMFARAESGMLEPENTQHTTISKWISNS